MKALTIRQPWAWAIINGGKDVENRTRNIAGAYRGPVAIHAGRGWSDLGAADRNVLGAMCAADPHSAPLVEALGQVERVDDAFEYGAVIGVVDLVDVHAGWTEPTPCNPWAQRYDGRCGLNHLVLTNPRALPRPIPWRGQLGLWNLPDDVLGEMAS